MYANSHFQLILQLQQKFRANIIAKNFSDNRDICRIDNEITILMHIKHKISK